MSKLEIRNHFSKPKVCAKMTQTNGAQQHFKDECDVNTIVKRYAQTGDARYLNAAQPNYGIHDSTSFHEAMNIVTEANQTFEQLPSEVRKKFNHDPAQFMDFVHNPDNKEELQKMGLLKAPLTSPTPSSSVSELGGAESDKTADKATGETSDS